MPVKMSDLDGWGLRALDHMKKFRPKTMAKLRREGNLLEVVHSMQEQAARMFEDLKLSIDPQQAYNETLRAVILLPDEEETEEETEGLFD